MKMDARSAFLFMKRFFIREAYFVHFYVRITINYAGLHTITRNYTYFNYAKLNS